MKNLKRGYGGEKGFGTATIFDLFANDLCSKFTQKS
jgi:hypothetical protein